MERVIETSLLLTYDELRILLYSQGFRSCEGIYMPDKDFTSEEVLAALHRLVRGGLLSVTGKQDGELFRIRDDLAQMVKIIGDPAGTLVIDDPDSGAGRYFCYVRPDAIVVSERYPGKADCLRLRIFSAEQFIQWREALTNDYRDSGRTDNGIQL